GRNRLRVGPSSTNAAETTRSPSSKRSLARSAFTRALAIALSTTFRIGSLAACGANFSTATASEACLPRMRSTTRRAFWGVTRTNRACALASIAVLLPFLRQSESSLAWVGSPHASAATTLPVVLHVAAEGPRGSELAELVADHRLGHEDRDVLATVVHGKGVTEEVGRDDRPTGPGLDDVLGPLLVLRVHLLLEVVVDEGALLQATRHVSGSYQRFLPVRRRRTISRSLDLFGRRVRPSGWPHGLTG